MKWAPIVAIICITTLEAIALIQDVNGAILGLAIAALAGLGGYELKAIIDKRKGGK